MEFNSATIITNYHEVHQRYLSSQLPLPISFVQSTSSIKIIVCLFVLRFYGPVNPICLCIKVIVAKMPEKKMTVGEIPILNQILIISMHIASLVKSYLLKLSSRNENMGVSRADNSVKI